MSTSSNARRVALVLILSFVVASVAFPASLKIAIEEHRRSQEYAAAELRDLGDDACFEYSQVGCADVGEDCGCPLGESKACITCKEGLTCDGGACVAKARLGQACTSSIGCYSKEGYALTCADGYCKGKDVFTAGETCSTVANEAVNGGCLAGLTCDGTCKPAYALGDNCTEVPVGCGSTAFCHEGVCTALLSQNANCTGLGDVCKPSLDCIAGVCLPYHSRTEGQSCNHDYFQSSCAAGLYCSADKVCIRPEHVGDDCSADESVCTAGTDCQCDYHDGETECRSLAVKKDMADALVKYVNCAEKHDADDNRQAFPGNKIADHCLKEVKEISVFFFGITSCSPASWLAPSFVLLSLLLLGSM